MGLTNFPNGVTSFGVPVVGDRRVFAPHTWFVDGDQGLDGYDGRDRDHPVKTMARVFDDAQFASGDVIYMRGNIREQLVTPAGIFDVSIIGAGNRPRHADAHTGNNGYSASTWRAPASGAVVGQANVRVLQQGWHFENILFVMGDSTAAGIEVVRDAGAGDAERDASHAVVRGCKFAGAGVGVRFGVAGTFTEIVNHVVVEDSEFLQCTYGIRGGIEGSSWTIRRNIFRDCTNALIGPLSRSYIYENIVNGFTAAANSGGIDLNGGSGLNVVSKNVLGGTYSNAGGYRVANANDVWWGNFTSVTSGTDLASINVADPA